MISEKFDSPSKRAKNFSDLLSYWSGSEGGVQNNDKPVESTANTRTETKFWTNFVDNEKAASYLEWMEGLGTCQRAFNC